MIRVNIDSSKLNSQIDSLFNEVSSIANKKNIQSISKATAAIAAKSFVKDVNSMARANNKSFHHLYEWGSGRNPLSNAGRNNSRLFRLKRVGSGENGSISLQVQYIQSTSPVPIPSRLLRPSKTGKSVTRRSVFRNKAEAMESGRSATWTAKRNIVFLGNNSKLVFRPAGTRISIPSMGGFATSRSLENFANKWSQSTANSTVSNSRLFPDLERAVAKVLNSNKPSRGAVNTMILSVCDKYGAKETTF